MKLMEQQAEIPIFLKLFDEFHRQYAITPSKFIDQFNHLLQTYYTGEITQEQLWSSLNEKTGTPIDTDRDWISEEYTPQRKHSIHIKLEQLKLVEARLIGVVNAGNEMLEVLERRGDMVIFNKVYKSTYTKFTLPNAGIFKYIIDFENADPENISYFDIDMRYKKEAEKAGMTIIDQL